MTAGDRSRYKQGICLVRFPLAIALPDQYQTRGPNILLLGSCSFGPRALCCCLVHMKVHTSYRAHLTGLLRELNEIIYPQKNARPMIQPFFHAMANKSHPL